MTEDRNGADRQDDRGALRRQALRERWFACSNALGWSVAARWPDAAVDAVCDAVLEGRSGASFERVVARWAAVRARAGIGLAETLTDLAALHTAVLGALGDLVPHDGGHLPGTDGSTLVRVVSLAWSDVTCGDLSETAVVDPLSGLPSARYLRTRLAEIYDGARAHGTHPGDDHALVVTTMSVAGWSRVAPLATAGEAAVVVFDAGESVAALGRSSVVVLAPRAGLAGRVKVLRRLVERRLPPGSGLLTAPVVRTVALPSTWEGACEVLDRLQDPESAASTGADAGGPEATAPAPRTAAGAAN